MSLLVGTSEDNAPSRWDKDRFTRPWHHVECDCLQLPYFPYIGVHAASPKAIGRRRDHKNIEVVMYSL